MRLAPSFASCSDAARGPLKPDAVGRVVADDGSGKPFRVAAPSGSTWWYTATALVAAEQAADDGNVVNSDNLVSGRRVRRGPDWRWGDQDGGGVGVLVSHDSSGWARVRWEHSGNTNTYRIGGSGKSDLVFVSDAVDDNTLMHAQHAHRLRANGRTTGYSCDVCGTHNVAGRYRCVAGCDWDICGTCLGGRGHRGEWRGPERTQWCSIDAHPDGPLCAHGPVIQSEHWSCCGVATRSGAGCFGSEVS